MDELRKSKNKVIFVVSVADSCSYEIIPKKYMEVKNSNSWHALLIEKVSSLLESSEKGLSNEEARYRLGVYGFNKIQRKSKDGILIILWRQVSNALIWVLIASSILAVLLGKTTDGLVVLAVVVVNTIIGFFQEYKAGKAIEALSDMVPENATVLRNGIYVYIKVADIVPGDVVQLMAGDRVPADMRIIYQKNLLVEEAALTGESILSQKSIEVVDPQSVLGDRKCMVYAGTLVSSGTAVAMVVETGMRTEFGKISAMLTEATDLQTPLTQKLGLVAKYLTIGILLVTLIIMVFGTYRATNEGIELIKALKDSLVFAVALAVGAIPEGLPAVVTIALAVGVQRMARKNAIIRKLPAVETLGSTTVICSDKTGTLTRNEMTVSELEASEISCQISGVGYNVSGEFTINGILQPTPPEGIIHLLSVGVLCSDASVEKTQEKELNVSGDPTEIALVVAAEKANIESEPLRKMFPRLDVVPFDSELQYMVTLIKEPAHSMLYVKGAPEVILNKCSATKDTNVLDKDSIHRQIELMGSKGMRVLAFAQKEKEPSYTTINAEDLDADFVFIGLVGMIDPPRMEAKVAIQTCHKAGIVVKMITGDHRATARAIGMELGLSADGTVVTGAELGKMSDSELTVVADKVNIFARVAPEHKLRLVKALQSKNQIVAMTGDGVNDAPSLKQSNIGVAMGITGTSVSKESADIVLADDNFSSIGAAVQEGRRVYDNLLKSLAFLLPTNLGLAFILIYGIVFFPFNPQTQELVLPMLPTQLLWINLVAAISLALPLAFEVIEPNVMNRPPRSPKEPLFSRFITFRIILVSFLMTVGTILVFTMAYRKTLVAGMDPSISLMKSQTMAVTFVIFFQVFYMLNCRSLKDTLFRIGLFSNKIVFIGIGAILLFQSFFIYLPFFHIVFKTQALSFQELMICFICGFVIFPVIAVEKWFLRKIEE